MGVFLCSSGWFELKSPLPQPPEYDNDGTHDILVHGMVGPVA